jgi:CheY-like chemotaxis protein
MESKYVVLVADDEPGVRAFAARIVQAAGYQVLEARDGVEALALAEAAGPALRLVITDLRMPRLRGDQLVHRLAAQRPGLAVLFMSASPPSGFESLLGADFMRHWLRKPFTPAALTAMVERSIGPGTTESAGQ